VNIWLAVANVWFSRQLKSDERLLIKVQQFWSWKPSSLLHNFGSRLNFYSPEEMSNLKLRVLTFIAEAKKVIFDWINQDSRLKYLTAQRSLRKQRLVAIWFASSASSQLTQRVAENKHEKCAEFKFLNSQKAVDLPHLMVRDWLFWTKTKDVFAHSEFDRMWRRKR
jgi:hypothetical protein